MGIFALPASVHFSDYVPFTLGMLAASIPLVKAGRNDQYGSNDKDNSMS